MSQYLISIFLTKQEHFKCMMSSQTAVEDIFLQGNQPTRL